MTSVGTGNTNASQFVGHHGMGLFGKKNPKWYPCVVKADNQDGTIKVQWDEDKKFTKRLPVENFRLDVDEEPMETDVPVDIFATKDGDY